MKSLKHNRCECLSLRGRELDKFQLTMHQRFRGKKTRGGSDGSSRGEKWAKSLGFVSGEPKGDGQAWGSTVGMSRAMPILELLIAPPWMADSSSGRGGHLGPKSPRFKSLPLLAL